MPSAVGYHALPTQHLHPDVKTVGRPSTVDVHVDALTSKLDDPSARSRRGAVQALGGLDASRGTKGRGVQHAALSCRLGDEDARTRCTAAYALVHRGESKAPQAMELAKRLTQGDPRNRRGIVEALVLMGETGAAALMGVLDHADRELRRMIIEGLGRMGTDASPYAAALAKYVEDDDAWVRTVAAESLAAVGTPFSPRIADLVVALEDGTGDIGAGVSRRGEAATRRRALQALGQRGASAAPHVKAVVDCLKDGDVGVQRRAAEALARFGADGETAAVRSHGSALTKCLQASSSAYLRTSAVEALLQMGPDAAPYAQDLSGILRDPDEDVRRKAAEALGRIGPPASRFVGSLAPLLQDPDAGCRRCAAEAMLQMGSAAAPYAHNLAALLDDSAAGMRWSILDGLKNLGRSGAEALASRLEDANALVRISASTSLDLMGTTGDEVLFSMQCERDQDIRLDAKGRDALGVSAPSRSMNLTDRQGGVGCGADLPAHHRMKVRCPQGSLGQGTSLGGLWTVR